MSLRTFTAVYRRDGEWWVAWIEEMPGAITQERTLDEVRQSLRDVIPILLEVQREQQGVGDVREELSMSV
jgi:predicted RNase H-like HicB family nuclease